MSEDYKYFDFDFKHSHKGESERKEGKQMVGVGKLFMWIGALVFISLQFLEWDPFSKGLFAFLISICAFLGGLFCCIIGKIRISSTE
jgi:hypothetical protein